MESGCSSACSVGRVLAGVEVDRLRLPLRPPPLPPSDDETALRGGEREGALTMGLVARLEGVRPGVVAEEAEGGVMPFAWCCPSWPGAGRGLCWPRAASMGASLGSIWTASRACAWRCCDRGESSSERRGAGVWDVCGERC